MIKLIEVKKTTNDYSPVAPAEPAKRILYELVEVWINPSSIIQIKADPVMKNNFDGGFLPEGLDSRQQFSKVHLGAGSGVSVITVVGDAEGLVEKLFGATRVLLKN